MKRGQFWVDGVALLIAGLLTAVAGAAAGRVTAAQRPALIPLELEDLVGIAQPSAGPTVRQEMQNFGPGWSGAQLFWRPPPPVDAPIRNWPHLRFSITVPATGAYEVLLRHTVAPDFGRFRVFLDGEPAGDVDGYGPAVAPRTRTLGQRTLKAGSHPIVVTVFSKAPAATGFNVGLDRLDLRPLAAEVAGQSAREPDVAGSRGIRATVITLDPSARLRAETSRRRGAAPFTDTMRVAAARSAGGVFADVRGVMTTFRWTPDAPVLPGGRGYMGGENIFVGAPEPLTIGLDGHDQYSNLRLVARGLTSDLYLLSCGLRLTGTSTLILHQIGPDAPSPKQVPSTKLLEIKADGASLGDELFWLVAAFKPSAPGDYAFLIRAVSPEKAVSYVSVSSCEISLMS